MGATSVTGVSGPGSVQKPGGGNKSAQGVSLGVANLVGPRVVMCGVQVVDADAGTAEVYFPTLPGTIADYAIILTGNSDDVSFFSDFTTSSFVINTGSTSVYWIIVKQGLWGSPVDQLANT